jgi:hypothetical protein
MDMDVDKIEEENKRTEKAIEDNLQRRAEQMGIAVAAGFGAPPGKKVKLAGGKLLWMMMILGIIGTGNTPTREFTA